MAAISLREASIASDCCLADEVRMPATQSWGKVRMPTPL